MPANRVLDTMLDRLFAAMVSGPNLNCRPHSSRQRIDLSLLSKLQDVTPAQVLGALLGETGRVRVAGRASAPTRAPRPGEPAAMPRWHKVDLQDADPATRAWVEQQSLLNKLRFLAEDALTYEQDTGVHALSVGFPLLSLPPGVLGGTRRLLAPLAHIPVSLSVSTGIHPGIEIACHGDDGPVAPNMALLAWLEHQTGKDVAEALSEDGSGTPWQDICRIVAEVARLLEWAVPSAFAQPGPDPLTLIAAPRGEEAGEAPSISAAAVLGLFPLANQALLNDTQEMIQAQELEGPIQPFVDVAVKLDQAAPTGAQAPGGAEAANSARRRRNVAEERPVTWADPCQRRAMRLARACRGLVVHGPPGTGKSQTITNIIGDHLALGQRVLFVCDKRTALDVVANRLEHLGLGRLCAVIHSPQGDRRQLYQNLRARLDELVELRTDAGAERQLQKLDQELQRIHDELSEYCEALDVASDEAPPLHDLIARWLVLRQVKAAALNAKTAQPVTLAGWQEQRAAAQDVMERAEAVRYHENPWARCAGIGIEEFLGRPMAEVRAAVAQAAEAGVRADATRLPAMLPFAAQPALGDQARQRAVAAEFLTKALGVVRPETAQRWCGQTPAALREARLRLVGIEAHAVVLRQGPLDPELALVAGATVIPLPQINVQIGLLEEYLEVAAKWHGFLHMSKRRAAAQILAPYGLKAGAEPAGRLRTFLVGLRSRLVLAAVHAQMTQQPPGVTAPPPDQVLEQFLQEHTALLDLLLAAQDVPGLPALVGPCLGDPAKGAAVAEGLRQSEARAAALNALMAALAESRLFEPGWLAASAERLRAGKAAGPDLVRLVEQVGTLEGVLRTRQGLGELAPSFSGAIPALLRQDLGVGDGMLALEKGVLEIEIARRCAQAPCLQRMDAHRLNAGFARYAQLEAAKAPLVCKVVLDLWASRQKEKLLVSTGTRLNSAGADLKRRLTLRGDHAMRLRQVIALGQAMEGGDPLLDLCPVWMASPESVAQLFPRRPMFDVVIFDEASQCRLEEALPVLTRGHRVVVAGDPRQLPPTRFFEAGVATSQQEDMETDQQLFEAQQGDIEDLLGAALNLEIQECYLDVHYRSRNADLIHFSNEHFYGSRLQPIPGHPGNRARFAPLTLRQVAGVYEERTNEAEAREVCRIIGDLLKRAEPPSIGVACFNLPQRDLIVEMLDEMAEADAQFAQRLAAARSRRGSASFEGLFVRNLESVQGDERDHIIISTTYGPDPTGKFRRQFGPLGLGGGGRRLNVLVTRARHEVHLVTSIPPEVYRALPPVPPGAQASGPWLLFAYLHYAETLARDYDALNHALAEAQEPSPCVVVRSSGAASPFAKALADHLLESQTLGSTVHWGNDGFCVDVALMHPRQADGVTVGLLCDGARYPKAQDPVEWDVFRTTVLEAQGWRLRRLWTPPFFRDPQAVTDEIVAAAADVAEGAPGVAEA